MHHSPDALYPDRENPAFPQIQQLSRGLAMLQATLECAPDGLLSFDEKGKVSHFNTQCEELWDFPEGFLASSNAAEFAASVAGKTDCSSRVLNRLETIRFSEAESFDQFELLDGRIVEAASKVPTIDGQACGRVWRFRDVTQSRKKELDSLRLAAIVAGSDDGIISKDLNGVITSWNPAAERIFGYSAAEAVGQPITLVIPLKRRPEENEILARLRQGERIDHFETVRETKDGRLIDVTLTVSPIKNADGAIVGASKIVRDLTEAKILNSALQKQKSKLAIVNSLGVSLSAEKNLDELVQAVTDAGRELSGAAFGAFFYTTTNSQGESFTLYTISGAPREAFSHFGMPRNTEIFGPTFKGEGVVRIPDVTRDPRYGKMAPHHGMPAGHLPVRSYLAVPVISRSGEVIGGLFFGHPEPDVFRWDSEELLLTIAAHAAVAIDNFRLHASLQAELEQQRQTEKALRESEDFSRSILTSTADCIKVVDVEGHLLSMNPPGMALFDIPDFGMVKGKLWPDLWPLETRNAVRTAMDHAQKGGTGRFQGRCLTAAGVPKWWDVLVSPLPDADGKVTRLTATSRDMTELRRSEEKLREAHEEAQTQSRIKDEFLATLSHELRTPLQSITGWVQILESPDTTPAEYEEGLQVISRNSEAQRKIIEDLLDMNRILSGKARLDIQRVDLAEVVEASVEVVKPAARAKEISLQAIIDPLAQHVAGDPNRLQQVCWNLLSNAIKFTPRGGSVQIMVERVNSHLEVSISDNGEGIEPEFLPHVFERFRQADATTTRRHGGLGLGLAIVKHLIELHGGNVRAKSNGVGRGATFTVSLPLAPVQKDPGETDQQPGNHKTSSSFPGHTPDINGIRVLIVDDELDTRTTLGKILMRAGADVTMADSGKEGLQAMARAIPEVIVSDIGMPAMDGYSFIKAVRKLSPSAGGAVPAIALTAYTRPEDRINAISAGFQMHLSKPADALELLTMVESLAKSGRKAS